MNIIKKMIFWLNCARLYSLPITILSWLVIFIFALKQGGKIIPGILALFGISLVHLATNLVDDYFDYKILSKDEKYMNSAKSCKCFYLRNNNSTIKDLRNVIITFLSIAILIGVILFFLSGPSVLVLALIGLVIALSYPKLSKYGFGEIAVIVAFGPLLFEGIYYVMTKSFSYQVLILSFACAMFTNTILYAHMLMDFDQDKCSHKTTLCLKLKTKENALNFIIIFYLVGYILISYLAFITHNFLYYLTFVTIPLVIDLYNSLRIYNEDKTILPKVHFWNYPLDNWQEKKNSQSAPFYLRFFYARNIMTFFVALACIAIILG